MAPSLKQKVAVNLLCTVSAFAACLWVENYFRQALIPAPSLPFAALAGVFLFSVMKLSLSLLEFKSGGVLVNRWFWAIAVLVIGVTFYQVSAFSKDDYPKGIDKKLERILDNQKTIQNQLKAISEELRIVKVRASS